GRPLKMSTLGPLKPCTEVLTRVQNDDPGQPSVFRPLKRSSPYGVIGQRVEQMVFGQDRIDMPVSSTKRRRTSIQDDGLAQHPDPHN
ncbi:unnamed protein product, partial [Allacma fusca]